MVHLLLVVIYLSFISLGLPDSLLGCAWPTMYTDLSVPLSYAGIVSMIIAAGTILSSLLSARLTRALSTGVVTLLSVATTAIALFGFSQSDSFIAICLWAVPYGLGAGGVDAALNNYVALHFASRHMSWLHAMWGIGTIVGPYVIGYALANGMRWSTGYLTISVMQAVLVAILLISLPLWKKSPTASEEKSEEKPPVLSLKQIFSIRGVKAVCITFFCYCAVEQTAMLWSASYLKLHCGVSAELAAELASLFYIGITLGRVINGFLAARLNDHQMIVLGQCVMAAGIILILLPLGVYTALAGIVLLGLGCGPVYPSVIHSTPALFGQEVSGSIIGVQMASAYLGTLFMPPLFGIIANHISVSLLPIYMLAVFLFMVFTYRQILKATALKNS